MKKILYILFRYYNEGVTKEVAYLKSIGVILLFLLINLLTLCALFDINLSFFAGSSLIKYSVFFLLYLVPGYFFINMLVKKKDVEDEDLELDYKKYHGWAFIIYAIISVVLLIIGIKFR